MGLLPLLGVLIFTLIFIQDFLSRRVSVYLFIGLFVLGSVYHTFKSGFSLFMYQLILNYSVLLLQFGVLLLYLWFTRKKFYNPINSSLGLGDIAFFLSLATWYSFETFFLLYTLSLIFSLIAWLLIKRYFSIKYNTIPLAGLASAFFFFAFLLQLLQENEMNSWLAK